MDRYVINRQLLDSIFNIFQVVIRRWEIQTYLHSPKVVREDKIVYQSK
jgi:hypothetical protein